MPGGQYTQGESHGGSKWPCGLLANIHRHRRFVVTVMGAISPLPIKSHPFTPFHLLFLSSKARRVKTGPPPPWGVAYDTTDVVTCRTIREYIDFEQNRSNGCRLQRHRDLTILQNGGRLQSWICWTRIWCTHKTLGGFYRRSKFGSNRCSSFDNRKVLIFWTYRLKTPTNAPKLFLGI